jgi:hypothetical protein
MSNTSKNLGLVFTYFFISPKSLPFYSQSLV